MNTPRLQLAALLTAVIMLGACNSAGRQENHKVFSIEEISKEEFIEADTCRSGNDKRFNEIFAYKETPDSITTEILRKERMRFEAMDPAEREDYDIEEQQYADIFSPDALIYADALDMYLLPVPTIHDCILRCYDSHSGEQLGEILYPFAISPDGVIAAQKGYDCDWPLDLHFYKRYDNVIFEFCSFKTTGYYSEFIMDNDSAENWNLPVSSFFTDNNTLYLSLISLRYFHNQDTADIIYLKITLPDF